MINMKVADDLILQYLKKEGCSIYRDSFVSKVSIDFSFNHTPVLEVVIDNFNQETYNRLVIVTLLEKFLSSVNYEGSIEGILGAYNISIDKDDKLRYITHRDDSTPKTETKAIDPKEVAGNKKLSFHEMPILTLASIAKPFADGAKKYGLKNFYDFESYTSVYLSALKRHLMLFEVGQDNTSDSNVHHVDSMIAGLMVMREKMLVGKLVDDRKKLDNDVIEKLEEMLNNDKV